MPVIRPLLFLVLFLPFSLSAQDSCQVQVTGRILDLETGEPLPYANVKLQGTDRGTVAGENGSFVLSQLCGREFNLEISYVGYKTKIHHHDVYHPAHRIYLAPTDQLLEGVVVEGEDIDHAFYSQRKETLDGDRMKEVSMGNLSGVFSSISGVSSLNTGQNVAKPIIHGLHSNRVLVINNGIRHEFQNWGAEHAPEIDPSMASSLSVIKGAASVRYGPDALGGVVMVEPPDLELFSPLAGIVGVNGRSNGRAAGLDFELGQGFSNFSFLVQGSGIIQGDLKTPDYYLTNTAKKEYSLGAMAMYHKDRLDLEFYYSHFFQNLGLLRGSVTGNIDDLANAIGADIPPLTSDFDYQIENPRQLVSHDLLKTNAKFRHNQHAWQLTYALQKNHREEYDVRRGNNNLRPAINLDLVTHSLDLDYVHPNWNKLAGSMGVQFQFQDNSNIPGTNTIPFIPNYNNTRLGLFAIESFSWQQNTVEMGIRYDYQFFSLIGRDASNDLYRNNLNFNQVTASVGYVRQISDNQTYRTNLGTAWRPPNVVELYSFGKSRFNLEYGLWRYQRESGGLNTGLILDQNSRPIRAENGMKWIQTYEWGIPGTQLEVSTFANYLQNYIFANPIGVRNTVRGAFPAMIYDQTDALFLGADGTMVMDHKWNLNSRLSLNYLWARDIQNQDYFVAIPPPRIQYRINWEKKRISGFSRIQFSAEADQTFSAFQYPVTIPPEQIISMGDDPGEAFLQQEANFDFMPPPPGYLLINLYATLARKNWTLRMQIRNLTNTAYRNYTDQFRYFSDETGIDLMLQLSYQF